MRRFTVFRRRARFKPIPKLHAALIAPVAAPVAAVPMLTLLDAGA